MALSDDQRAMLRLLAQREEGYEDIAALKGMSVEDVRAEVKEALAQLAADREAAAQSTPAPEESKPEPTAKVEAPPAEAKPAEPAKAERPAPASPKSSAAVKPSQRPSRPTVPPERRRFLLLAGGALGVVAVVLIAIAVFGDSSDSGNGSASANGSGTEPTAAENASVTQAVLEPVDGSDASGRALFGKIGQKEIVLQVTAEGLEPTDEGESYTVWLYRTPKLSLRVGSVAVDDSGRLGARFPIPTELLAYIASGAFDQIYVSRTSDAAYEREVAQAKKEKSLPRYSGETVLTGKITGPVVKAASREGG